MRLTKSNLRELAILRHFVPAFMRDLEIDSQSVNTYFAWSDRGVDAAMVNARIADESRTKDFTGLSALYYAKRYRDLQITSYKEDWGITVLAWDFVDDPLVVVEFLAKTLNKPFVLEAWHEHNDWLGVLAL